MSYITWTLDDEYELDGNDFIGEIKIIGDKGFIEEQCTTLDLFLEALAQYLEQVPQISKISVDTIVEPSDIYLEYVNDVLTVSYKNRHALIYDLARFKKDVLTAITDLVVVIDTVAESKNLSKWSLSYFRECIEATKIVPGSWKRE